MLHTFLMIIHFFCAAAIVALVLLQRGKGAEAGAGFGAGASGTVFGARGASTALSRATAILAAIFPFVGWPLLLAQVVMPTAGRSRLGAVVSVWIGGTTVAVSLIYWLYALLGYNPSGSRVEWSNRLVPYMPKVGIAVGLFGLCMLCSGGIWGLIAAIIRPEMAVAGTAITGCVLFLIIYGAGWLLFVT